MKFAIIDIWQGSECASSSEYISVTQDSAENSLPYSLGSQYARVRMCKGCEFAKVTQGFMYTV